MSFEHICTDGTVINFPLKPYASQIEVVNAIVNCLNTNTSALIESPTGSGKSFSILCSVIAFLDKSKNKSRRSLNSDNISETPTNSNTEYNTDVLNSQIENLDPLDNLLAINSRKTSNKNTGNNIKIYICSRTIKQIDQLISQLFKLKPSFKCTILSSRKHLCINKNISNDTNINDACHSLLKKKPPACSFFTNHEKLQNYIGPVFNIEEAYAIGVSHRACPYFYTRGLLPDADVVFAPYNYLVDPFIRRSLNVDLKDAFVIIDEAHNVEDFCRKAGSCVITSHEIVKFLDIMKKIFLSGLEKDLSECIIKVRGFLKMFMLLSQKLQQEPKANTNKVYDKRSINILKDLNNFQNNNYNNTNNNLNTFNSVNNNYKNNNYNNTNNNYKNNNYNNTNNNYKNNNYNNTNNNYKNNATTFSSEICLFGPEIKTSFESFSINSQFIASTKNSFKTLNSKTNDILPNTVLNSIEVLLFILETIIILNSNAYSFSLKTTSDNFTMSFYLLDPGVIFKSLSNNAKGIVLLSGTLKPFYFLQNELDFNFKVCLDAPHNFNKDNLCVSILQSMNNKDLIGTYAEKEGNKTYLNNCVEAIIKMRDRIVTGGGLVFVPSYSFLKELEKCINNSYESGTGFVKKNNLEDESFCSMEEKRMKKEQSPGMQSFDIFEEKRTHSRKVINGISDGDEFQIKEICKKQLHDLDNNKDENKQQSRIAIFRNQLKSKINKNKTDTENINPNEFLFFETQNPHTFEKTFKKYKKAIKTKIKPLLFCVYRGRCSEGMDFADDYARLVILIGIPFANFKDTEIVCKKKYNDNYKKLNGKNWYEIQAFRAVNQAIGRVVRHKEDYGCLVFLDKRYGYTKNTQMLPKWVKENLKIINDLSILENKIGTFLNDKASTKSSH